MGAVDSPEKKDKGKKGSKKKKKRRLSIRIDMTPMVDVAFLLLTFFMLTTYFSQPQVIEINLPPDEKTQVEVGESSLLVLRVDPLGKIFWAMGSETPAMIDQKDLNKLLADKKQSVPNLVVLFKIDRDGTYKMFMDIYDEIKDAGIGRISPGRMTDADKRYMEKAKTS